MALLCDISTGNFGVPGSALDRRVCMQRSTPLSERAGPEHSTRSSARSSASCSAVAGLAVDRLPLSSYKFPQIPSGRVQPTPLECAVKEAVVHLDQAPFLQLQHRGSTNRHSVDNSVLEEPQLWKGIAAYLREKNTELVLLLYPLDAPAKSRASQPAPNSGEVMTGITNASHQSKVLSFAELVRAGATTANFSGQVGECCEEEARSQVVAFRRRAPHSSDAAEAQSASEQNCGSAPAKKERSLQGPASYWGVVLQSKDGREGGCYVLKTTHSAVVDCTCVHWSLTRVCSGAPLFDQVSSAWLL